MPEVQSIVRSADMHKNWNRWPMLHEEKDPIWSVDRPVDRHFY